MLYDFIWCLVCYLLEWILFFGLFCYNSFDLNVMRKLVNIIKVVIYKYVCFSSYIVNFVISGNF